MKMVRMVLAAIAVTIAFGMAPASAQSTPCGGSTYPPGQSCGVSADRTSVAPGGQLTLTGQCPSGTTTVRFRLTPGDADLGTAQPAANGSFSRTVTIPSGTAVGSYQITATCEGVAGAGVVRSVAITVASGGGSALPRTGSSSTLPTAMAGAGLVAVGAIAVLAVRRRRTAPSPA